jgi:hypothetical protein
VILSDSRYSDGTLQTNLDSRKDIYSISVGRVFPEDVRAFFYYTWTSADRIDLIALKFLGDPELWWQIMDLNPELSNPLSILPGSLVRIPSV